MLGKGALEPGLPNYGPPVLRRRRPSLSSVVTEVTEAA